MIQCRQYWQMVATDSVAFEQRGHVEDQGQ